MKEAYPIISKENEGFYVFIPDFNIATQGSSIANSIMMARDTIEIIGIDMLADCKELPKPSSVKSMLDKDDIITLVDVDFTEY